MTDEHRNITIMREAIRRHAEADAADAVVTQAVNGARWAVWEDFGATFAFVGGALRDALSAALGEATATAACDEALDVLLKDGKWDANSMPPPGPVTLPPSKKDTPKVPTSDPYRAPKGVKKHATAPYLSLGSLANASDDEDG